MKYIVSIIITLGLFFSFTMPAGATSASPELQHTVTEVWGTTPHSTWMNSSSVTWKLGYPPDGTGGYYAGATKYTCTVFIGCKFEITIHPDYNNNDVIAHEGGHTLCIKNWGDTSEKCADNLARKWYPAYPY